MNNSLGKQMVAMIGVYEAVCNSRTFLEEAKQAMEKVIAIEKNTAGNAEASEVRNGRGTEMAHGQWKKRTIIIFDCEKIAYRCSECNTTWDVETNYCPNCGAKMNG